MEAVYQLLAVERGVPEVFASAYDLRTLAKAVYYLTDKKKLRKWSCRLSNGNSWKASLRKPNIPTLAIC